MKLRSSLSKLNAYTKGSFFKPHREYVPLATIP